LQSDREGDSYPFAFRVQHTFTLDEANGFQLDTAVTNLDREPIPVGWGWHPYLQLGGTCDSWRLRLPPCRWLGVDERMLPTGKSYPYSQFDRLRPIGAEVLDNCLELQVREGSAEVLLEGPAGRITYWQEAGAGRYPFLQVFTHPMRESIALEPMTCAVDGLNSGQGRLVLDPGELVRASFGLRFEAG
jgi:aldose 1-epimerase